MRLHIDKSLCIGCGLCEETLPGVAVTGRLTARVINPEIPAYLVEAARGLIEYCPVEAVSIEEVT